MLDGTDNRWEHDSHSVEARPARTRDLLPFIIMLIALAISSSVQISISSYDFTFTYFIFCPFFCLSYDLSFLKYNFPNFSPFPR
jgi:hypothetical protein